MRLARKRTKSSRASRPAVRRNTGQRAKVENIQKLRKDRADARNISGKLVAGLFFGAVFIYLIQTLYTFVNKPSIPSVTVQYGSIDSPQIIRGIIIRNEKIYKSTSEGTVNYEVKDQDKIKKGTLICSIRDEDALAPMEKDIEELDKTLMELQDRRSDISEAQKEADKINSRIKDTVDKDIYNYASLNIRQLYALRDEVEQNIKIRNQILLSENKGSLRSYADERLIYQEEMNRHITPIYAEEGGILSTAPDGLEEVFNFDNMDTLTKEQTTMKADLAVSRKVVAVDDAVFKIVLSNEWYIGAYIANDLIYEYEEGAIRNIYVEQGDVYEPREVTVSQIIKGENESYVLFKSTKNILDYINKRSISIKTTDSVYTGFKIPNSAIVDRTLLQVPLAFTGKDDEGNYVLKKTDELTEKNRIAIKDSNEDYVYVLQDFSNVKLGDVLVNPENTAETCQLGEIVSVKGVYLINSGIAEFRKITMDADIPENNGYTILDPAVNKTIMSHDRIVSEAKNIQDGQIIY